MITAELIDRATRITFDLGASDADGMTFLFYQGGSCIRRERLNWTDVMILMNQLRVETINKNPSYLEDDEEDYDDE